MRYVESYERIQDALILLKMISQSEEDFRKGRWLSQAQMEKQLRKNDGVPRQLRHKSGLD